MKELSIITGGSSGLGYAIAAKLVAQQKNVALIGRDVDKLDKCGASLKASGTDAEVLTFVGDISDESFAKEVFESLAADQWEIRNLFNCAGVGRFGKPEENTRQKTFDYQRFPSGWKNMVDERIWKNRI
jgi:short-subunit dehydrogenase